MHVLLRVSEAEAPRMSDDYKNEDAFNEEAMTQPPKWRRVLPDRATGAYQVAKVRLEMQTGFPRLVWEQSGEREDPVRSHKDWEDHLKAVREEKDKQIFLERNRALVEALELQRLEQIRLQRMQALKEQRDASDPALGANMRLFRRRSGIAARPTTALQSASVVGSTWLQKMRSNLEAFEHRMHAAQQEDGLLSPPGDKESQGWLFCDAHHSDWVRDPDDQSAEAAAKRLPRPAFKGTLRKDNVNRRVKRLPVTHVRRKMVP